MLFMTPFDVVGEIVKQAKTKYLIEVDVFEFSAQRGIAQFSVVERNKLIPRTKSYSFETCYEDSQAEFIIESLSAAIAQDYTIQWNPPSPEEFLKAIHGTEA